MLTLQGLKNYISRKYPDISVFYTNSVQIEKDKNFQQKIKNKETAWIVFQHGKLLHKTLLMIEPTSSETFIVHIFDSLGKTPYSDSEDCPIPRSNHESYRSNLTDLLKNISKNIPITIEDSIFSRQRDATNCSIFVLEDLETALKLQKEKKNFFQEYNELSKELSPDFFKSDQMHINERKNLEPTDIRNISSNEKDGIGNAHALLHATKILQHFFQYEVCFAEENHLEEGQSDTDKEDNGCNIM